MFSDHILKSAVSTSVLEARASSGTGRSRGPSSYSEREKNRAPSYRLICLFGTMGKFLEKLILQRFQSHMKGQNSLLGNEFSFWKGTSTVDSGHGRIDLRNAFRSAR